MKSAIAACLVLGLLLLAGGSWAAPFPMPAAIGPALRFSRVSGNKAYYSLLLGAKGSASTVKSCVKLNLKGGTVGAPEVLDSYAGYTFLRWKIAVSMGAREQAVTYQLKACSSVKLSATAATSWSFYVPGRSQSWHWAYYSCNGHPKLSDAPPGGVDPMWTDLLGRHAVRKLHLVAGNGDQLYNDGVLESHPAIQAAAFADNTAPTLKFKWTPEIEAAANNWFFSHYAFQWSVYSPPYTKAMATIPFTMMLDDHDVVNGFGSQPPSILNSPLLQGLAKMGRRWYVLFQQHSSATSLMDDLKWNGNGPALHIVSRLGPSTAILVPDVRWERTRDQVMSHASYARIKKQLDTLPSSVKQLVVLTPQPMAFPVITATEDAILDSLSNLGIDLNWAAVQDFLENPIGRFTLLPILKAKLPIQFGTVDISDLLDHWSSVQHREERAQFVNLLQAWSAPRKVRITYVAGDAHLAFANQFASEGSTDPKTDPRWSLSLISSAIGNNAFTAGGKLLESTSPTFSDTLDESGKTVITELRPFSPLIPGLPLFSFYSAAARNWLEVAESPAGELLMALRFEHYANKKLKASSKLFTVPRLQ